MLEVKQQMKRASQQLGSELNPCPSEDDFSHSSFEISIPKHPQKNTKNFLTNIVEQLIQNNYQSIYDCFFTIFKKRQSRMQAAASAVKENHEEEEEDILTMLHGKGNEARMRQPRKSSSMWQQSRASLKRPLVKEPAPNPLYEATSDDLYLPSSFHKNKKASNMALNSPTKYDNSFMNLIEKLVSEFYGSLCEVSPFLDSIIDEVEEVNKIIQKTTAQQKQLFENQRAMVKKRLSILSLNNQITLTSGQQEMEVLNPQFYTLQISVDKGKSKIQVHHLDKKLEELNTLKNKIEELDNLNQNQRKMYYKDLMVYKSNVDWRNLQKHSIAQLPEEDRIPVQFFDVMQGLDPQILEVVNGQLAEMKIRCERRISMHLKYQEELTKKLHLSDKANAGSVRLLNADHRHIIATLFAIEGDVGKVWEELHVHYGKDCFIGIIEKEYAGKFTKDYHTMTQEVEKIQEEAKFQIGELFKQTKEELQVLRRQLDEKNLELNKMSEEQLKEMEKAHKEAYFNAEVQFKSQEAKLFQKYDEEKQELYVRLNELEEINQGSMEILTRQELKICFMKMFMVAKFSRLLEELRDQAHPSQEPLIDRAILRLKEIVTGKANMGYKQMKDELDKDIKNLMGDNNEIRLQLAEQRQIKTQLLEKISYLEDCIEELHQETQMYKSQIDSVKEEARQLRGEFITLTRVGENQKALIEQLEKEKVRLQVELQKLGGANKYQSAVAESEIHRKKVMNNLSNMGHSTVNAIYANNQKTKATQTFLKDVNNEIEMKKVLMDGSVLIKQKFEQYKENKECQVDAADFGFSLISDSQLERFLELGRAARRSPAKVLEVSQVAPFQENSPETPLKILTPIRSPSPRPLPKTPARQVLRTLPAVDEEVQCEIDHPLGFLQSLGRGYSAQRDVDRYFSKQYIEDTKRYFQRLLEKSEKVFKQHRDDFLKLPEVYKRLWSDVLDKAVRFDKIKEEYKNMRTAHWEKMARDLNRPNQRGPTVVHRDAHSGKVFINLVELYSNKNIEQIVTNPNQKHLINYLIEESIFKDEVRNSPQKPLRPGSSHKLYTAETLKEGSSSMIFLKMPEVPIHGQKTMLVSEGTQTDPPVDARLLREFQDIEEEPDCRRSLDPSHYPREKVNGLSMFQDASLSGQSPGLEPYANIMSMTQLKERGPLERSMKSRNQLMSQQNKRGNYMTTNCTSQHFSGQAYQEYGNPDYHNSSNNSGRLKLLSLSREGASLYQQSQQKFLKHQILKQQRDLAAVLQHPLPVARQCYSQNHHFRKARTKKQPIESLESHPLKPPSVGGGGKMKVFGVPDKLNVSVGAVRMGDTLQLGERGKDPWSRKMSNLSALKHL